MAWHFYNNTVSFVMQSKNRDTFASFPFLLGNFTVKKWEKSGWNFKFLSKARNQHFAKICSGEIIPFYGMKYYGIIMSCT